MNRGASNITVFVAAIFIIGMMVWVLSSGANTSGKATASEAAVSAEAMNAVFAKTQIGEKLPATTAVRIRVYLTDESDFKEFFVEQGGVSEYSGESYELGLEIWRGTFSALYRSGDLCEFKKNLYRIEQKETFRLLKYASLRNLCD